MAAARAGGAEPPDAEGVVFDVQRFSLHDGPGIRTTVFLKGCNVRCAWCHNPESFGFAPQLSVDRARCTGCGACAAACPRGAHALGGGVHRLDEARCDACGACVDACPGRYRRVIGQRRAASDVIAQVLRDRPYYEKSGGGVTFSGGEATAQPAFLEALLARAKAAGLHICLETNGLTPVDRLVGFAAACDLVLLDFKVADDAAHRRWVGASNAGVFAALDAFDRAGVAVLLRCPVVPGVNDHDAHRAAVAALAGRHACVRDVEWMPYHGAGAGKWENIGLAAPVFPPPISG